MATNRQQPPTQKAKRKRRAGGGPMLERRSIRLTEDIAHEVDDLAARTYRNVPALVRLLITIGLRHKEELAGFDRG